MLLDKKDLQQIEKRCTSLQKKIDRLKDDSFEKRHLRPFFISKKLIGKIVFPRNDSKRAFA